MCGECGGFYVSPSGRFSRGHKWPFVTNEEKPSLSLLLWFIDTRYLVYFYIVPWPARGTEPPTDSPHPVTEATSSVYPRSRSANVYADFL